MTNEDISQNPEKLRALALERGERMSKERKRFEESFEPCPASGCFIWTGIVHKCGYGQFHRGRKTFSAHRVSYEIYNGPIPKGMWVLHRCDVRCCVNPSHLFLGTRADNSADMVKKGRSTRGEKSSSAKLTEDDVHAIRASNSANTDLARVYGVTNQQISDIKRRKKWRHILI